jgi:hypothetical protein
VVLTRRVSAYVVANIWELMIAGGYVVQTLLYLLLPHLLAHTTIARAFAEPFDLLLTLAGLGAGGMILAGTFARHPKLRAAGLVILAGTVAVRVIATFSVYGWVLAVYSLPLSLAAVVACLTRTVGIVKAGDYPPPAAPPFAPWER